MGVGSTMRQGLSIRGRTCRLGARRKGSLGLKQRSLKERPRTPGRAMDLGTGGTQRVVPSPMLKDGHHSSIRQSLDSVARDVKVSRSVLHHYEKLGRIGFDAMLPAVQWTTIKHRVPGIFIPDAVHRVMVSRLPSPATPVTGDCSGAPLCEKNVPKASTSPLCACEENRRSHALANQDPTHRRTL